VAKRKRRKKVDGEFCLKKKKSDDGGLRRALRFLVLGANVGALGSGDKKKTVTVNRMGGGRERKQGGGENAGKPTRGLKLSAWEKKKGGLQQKSQEGANKQEHGEKKGAAGTHGRRRLEVGEHVKGGRVCQKREGTGEPG